MTALRLFFLCAAIMCVKADFYIPNFTGFNDTNLQNDTLHLHAELKGGGRIVETQGTLQMPAGAMERATVAIWYDVQQYIQEGFNVTFNFSITDLKGPGGDGFAFIIQAYKLQGSVGAEGAGLGYGGLPDSLAIEFDTYKDPDYRDPNANHISVHTRNRQPNSADETYSIGITSQIPNLKDGKIHHVYITYIVKDDPTESQLSIFLDFEPNPVLQVYTDIPEILRLDNGYAYAGFSAATGTFSELHTIYDWKLVGEPVIFNLTTWSGPITGNTIVTVNGDNFKQVKPGKLFCLFGNMTVSADYIDGQHLVCVSPAQPEAAYPFTVTFDGGVRMLKTNQTFIYYIPPTITSHTPLSGPTTGGTRVLVKGDNFRADLEITTVCKFGNSLSKATVVSREELECTTNSLPLTELNKHVVVNLNISLNNQQFTDDGLRFNFYRKPSFVYFKPRGGPQQGGGTVSIMGNFSASIGLACKFGQEVVTADEVPGGNKFQDIGAFRCTTPSSNVTGKVQVYMSGNGQQWVPVADINLSYTYDAALAIWLIAGTIGFSGFLWVTCCTWCWSSLWKLKDYRLVASKEYREMTGQSPLTSVMSLLRTKQEADRQKTLQVLSILKMKKKSNKINRSSTNRWAKAGLKALDKEGKLKPVSGWDALLFGDHPNTTPAHSSAGAAGGGGAAAAPAAGSAISKIGGGWGALIAGAKAAETGGGGAAAAAPAKPATGGGGGGWGALLAANKTSAAAASTTPATQPAAAPKAASGWGKLAAGSSGAAATAVAAPAKASGWGKLAAPATAPAAAAAPQPATSVATQPALSGWGKLAKPPSSTSGSGWAAMAKATESGGGGEKKGGESFDALF